MELCHMRYYLAAAHVAELSYIRQPSLHRSPIRCSPILLPCVNHQPQVPILVDGQGGVFKRLDFAVDHQLAHAIAGGVNVVLTPPCLELRRNPFQFVHQFVDIGFLCGAGVFAAEARQHQRCLFIPGLHALAQDGTPDNLVGSDPAGYAGLEDDVDWHWGRIVAGAALTTLLGVGA